MTNEQVRAEFEAWVSTQSVVKKYGAKLHRSSCGNHYKDLRINQRWLAFKAGRAATQSQDREDTERLDWLRDNSCDLRCIDVPTGFDDYSIQWRVIEHHMAKPHEREIGRSFEDDPRAAIDHARRIDGGSNADS